MRSPEDVELDFDYNGVICSINEGDYANAMPYMYAIANINKAYDMGYYIKIVTARYGHRHPGKQYQVGYEEAIDWLNRYDVKFHQLIMEKPAADLYVDDKGCRVESSKGQTDWENNFWPAVKDLENKNEYGRNIH